MMVVIFIIIPRKQVPCEGVVGFFSRDVTGRAMCCGREMRIGFLVGGDIIDHFVKVGEEVAVLGVFVYIT